VLPYGNLSGCRREKMEALFTWAAKATPAIKLTVALLTAQFGTGEHLLSLCAELAFRLGEQGTTCMS
jgi:hypothetical protein